MNEMFHSIEGRTEENKLVQYLKTIRREQQFNRQSFCREDNESSIIDKIVIRKPWNSEFIRVLDETIFAKVVDVLCVDSLKLRYIINNISTACSSRFVKKEIIYFAMNDAGEIFIWPIKHESSPEFLDPWNRSALEAISQATRRWVSLTSNMKSQSYILNYPTKNIAEPDWPSLNWIIVGDKVLERATRPGVTVNTYGRLVE